MIRILKRAAAAVLTAVMIITAAGCGDSKVEGNLSEVKYGDNGTYAIIKVKEFGEITAKLFPDAAPKSVERFIEFAERGYYDNRTIHRVINDYLIQGGSLNGDGSDGNIPESQYIPVETSDQTYNFYGALCFASSKSGSYAQFYIVGNNKPQDIDAVIDKISGQLADESISARLLPEDKKKYEDYLAELKAIPAEVKEKYAKSGGLYELDGENTVFGQVIKGFDVLRSILSVEVVSGNKIDDRKETPSKPLDSIIIETVEIVKIEPQTTEETTTKKGSKTVKTTTADEIINAETLPTLASSDDTTGVPEESGSEGAEAENSAENAADSQMNADEAVESAAPETQEAADADTVPSETQIASATDPDEDEIVVIEE